MSTQDKIQSKVRDSTILKNINVEIPRNQMTVITGLSGSGKSSLAFDTLYAEGQRRYVESLSAYARMFLDRLQKPKVGSISGLSPAIAIEQRHAGSNPRSTVATTTEIYDYLRLLYAHTGTPHCPDCGANSSRRAPKPSATGFSNTREPQTDDPGSLRHRGQGGTPRHHRKNPFRRIRPRPHRRRVRIAGGRLEAAGEKHPPQHRRRRRPPGHRTARPRPAQRLH